MICRKCGAEIGEGMIFCSTCGAKVEVAETVETVEIGETEVLEAENTNETIVAEPIVETVNEEEVIVEPVAKKKKVPTKLIVAFVIVAALVGGFFAFKDEILGRIAFLLPAQTQMQMAYKSSAEDLASNVSEITTSVSKADVSTDAGVKGSVSVTLGNEAKKLLEQYADVDLGDLSKANIDYEMRSKDNMILVDAKVGLGNINIVSANVVMDMNEGVMAMSFPELSDTAVELDLEYDMDFDVDEFQQSMEQMEVMTGIMQDILPSEELLNDMLPRYAGVIIKAMDEVERGKDKVKVGSVSQKLTSLTVELDKKMVKNIGEAIADELKDDKEFKNYLKKAINSVMEYTGQEKISSSDFNDGYKEIAKGIEDAFDSIAEESVFEEGIEIVTWVNSKNEIVGVEIYDAFEIMSVKDGKKVAKHLLLTEPEDNSEFLKVLIEGEENKDVFAGEVVIYAEEEEVFAFDVDKYVSTEDTFELAVTVPITDEMLDEFGVKNPLGDITVKAEVKLTSSSTYLAVKANVAGKEWLAIENSNNSTKGADKIAYPKDVVSSYDVDEWAEDIDLSKVIENLEKSGLLDVLGMDADELKDSLSGNRLNRYEDSYYDSYNDSYYDSYNEEINSIF